jgi:regulator of ribosome biosynthesis
LEKATEGCSQLLSGLWKLETEKTSVGPLATLPSYFEYKTPRELPPPPPKTETKWEKFAKERGIAPKGKNSRKVWDEGTNSWTYLTGAHRSTSNPDDPQSWPIMEVGGNDDPYEDPWQKARDDKKDRVEKNIESRMRNEERAGNLTKGTTRRTMKAKKAAREAGRSGGDLDMQNFSNIPAGVPMDITKGKQRGMELTKKALRATQISTASLGKFDQMREGEPERKKAMNSGLKKRKFDSGTDSNVVKTEAKKSMKVLETVMTGGGKAKERAIRKGDFSKGTTAYDYDYDDGLSSSYKKKKGRAGMGKMKKITKKRAK